MMIIVSVHSFRFDSCWSAYAPETALIAETTRILSRDESIGAYDLIKYLKRSVHRKL